MITACNEPNKTDDGTDVLVYPEAIRYIGIKTEEQIKLLVEDQVIQGKICDKLTHEPLSFKHIALVCTHGTRDKRCGRMGPLVLDKLNEVCEAKAIPDAEITVRASSHLGGHKYAGVVVVYPEGDWYGFITNRNVEELVDAYRQGHRLDPNFRGNALRLEYTKEEH